MHHIYMTVLILLR